jgi:hypothetical protein
MRVVLSQGGGVKPQGRAQLLRAQPPRPRGPRQTHHQLISGSEAACRSRFPAAAGAGALELDPPAHYIRLTLGPSYFIEDRSQPRTQPLTSHKPKPKPAA